jgi:glyoxylase-like metal-dependent hydrolase (beta-lactamase superfamily II)
LTTYVPPATPERVSPLVRRVIAPNAGPFTHTGTCSYVVGTGEVAIIDPGPDDPRHIDALLATVAGERVRAIMVTHTHRDHSPAARRLKAATGATIAGCAAYTPAPDMAVTGPGLDAAHDTDYAPDTALSDGARIDLGGATIVALETPGHTANHLCFSLPEEKALFTGDHIMAWSTTVIAPPDGSMTDYMAQVRRLRARDDAVYWPGHGEPVRDPQRYLRALIHHRRTREIAILRRLTAGDETIADMVARIYENVDRRLHHAAGLTVFAHLEDLIARGLVESAGPATLSARYRRRETPSSDPR